MISDPIADALIQIKNGYLAGKNSVTIPHSNMKEELFMLLTKSGFIESAKVTGEKVKKTIQVKLKYKDKKPVLTNVVKVSKPSLRVYVNKDSIPWVLGSLGTVIISTSNGLITGSEARKRKTGGEVICKIW